LGEPRKIVVGEGEMEEKGGGRDTYTEPSPWAATAMPLAEEGEGGK
jgi:hypothetical protein